MFNHLAMFKKQLYTDCKIKIGNVTVNTHKCVLAGNSKLFEEMIEQSIEIFIDCSCLEVGMAIIESLYSYEISFEIMDKYYDEIIMVAKKYKLDKIMERFFPDVLEYEQMEMDAKLKGLNLDD